MMRGLCVALVCVGLLCVSAPTFAAGSAENVTATQAYLRGSESYARRAYVTVAARAAAVEARASEIAVECPSALTYAPRDAGFGELEA
jgi:outer membrane lipoprotein-sorting protein